ASAPVGRLRVVVRLVDRLPPADEVAEGLGDEVDVPSPRLGPVSLDEEAAAIGEPPRQREVVEADPGHDPGLARRSKDAPVVSDGPRVADPAIGLDSRPLDGQTMVAKAELGEQAEVLGVARGEAVAVAGDGRTPGPLPVPPVRGGRGSLALRRGCG